MRTPARRALPPLHRPPPRSPPPSPSALLSLPARVCARRARRAHRAPCRCPGPPAASAAGPVSDASSERTPKVELKNERLLRGGAQEAVPRYVRGHRRIGKVRNECGPDVLLILWFRVGLGREARGRGFSFGFIFGCESRGCASRSPRRPRISARARERAIIGCDMCVIVMVNEVTRVWWVFSSDQGQWAHLTHRP